MVHAGKRFIFSRVPLARIALEQRVALNSNATKFFIMYLLRLFEDYPVQSLSRFFPRIRFRNFSRAAD